MRFFLSFVSFRRVHNQYAMSRSVWYITLLILLVINLLLLVLCLLFVFCKCWIFAPFFSSAFLVGSFSHCDQYTLILCFQIGSFSSRNSSYIWKCCSFDALMPCDIACCFGFFPLLGVVNLNNQARASFYILERSFA